ncbi:hypothetical protein [Actinocorallia sp. A-T 12471]|uniref:hypothetical protein n=1 Tax=Actinocorallia sp. A-T 12471 TaxID=3089813 RepID=UPI0029CDBA8D|nr:hypothetical protein [Actinocorallia sp. A-T 12471]MDX6740443.1 hypothetical protein [Actinocorallia sp. A-T 12471]
MGCAFVGQENGRLEAGPEARWRFIQDQHDVLVLTEQRTEDLGLFVRRGYRSRRSVSCPEFAPVACPDDLFALPTVLRRSEQAALLGEWTFARVVIPRLHGKDSEACLYAALMLLALGSPEQRVLALLDKASMWAADTSENRTKVAEIDELWNESSDDWVNRCLALRIIENRADLATRYQYHDAEAMFRDILARLDGGDWMFLSAPVQPQAPAV